MTTVDLKQRWQTFRSWPWGVRWASYVTAALVLTLIATLLTGTVLVRRPFPLVDGEIELAGLKGNVQVIRDENGIPQIYADRSAAHTSELQSIMRLSYADFCLKYKKTTQ